MMNVEDDRNCWVLANKLKFLLKAENTDAKIYMIQQNSILFKSENRVLLYC